MAHLFLQGAHFPIKFHNFVPWSIFVFKTQVSEDQELNFDYRDSFIDFILAIRMRDISVIAVLQDDGAQSSLLERYMNEIQKLRIHPTQFGELCARITYQQRLLNRAPKYIITELSDRFEVFSPPLQGYSTKPIYNDWNQEAYSHHLAFHIRLAQRQVFSPPDKVMSWLHDQEGMLTRISGDPQFK